MHGWILLVGACRRQTSIDRQTVGNPEEEARQQDEKKSAGYRGGPQVALDLHAEDLFSTLIADRERESMADASSDGAAAAVLGGVALETLPVLVIEAGSRYVHVKMLSFA